MIIQNLHKKNSSNILKIKTGILLVLILLSCPVFSQDSITFPDSVSEKENLEFQEHFFAAITQKAINNYQKAIENLEECNVIIPYNASVLFELSKNYLKLNKTPQALAYIEEALSIDSHNIWLLEHAVTVHRKQRNYTDAIVIQKIIAEKQPKKKREIVYLHLQNNDTKSAKEILSELAAAKMLNARLRRIQKRLTLLKNIENTGKERKIIANNNKGSFKAQYEKNKSFDLLKKLLQQLDEENNTELLSYSNQGLQLFPAQPLVYLMNGKAHNKNKAYKKAIENLQNGIDFVIDNIKMEKSFYTELVNAYKGLGDLKNATKYQKKL